MFITNIERLPRKKNRIYIDGEYAFMLYDRDIAAYKLERYTDSDPDLEQGVCPELPEHLYEKIMKETVIRRAHQKAVALLERMDRSEADLRRHLKLDMYSESVTDETVLWLKSLHYLDDDRFAQSYIRGRIENTSKQELTSKLLAKGVAKDVINAAYDVCCEEVGLKSGTDFEDRAAVKVLKKKLGSKSSLTPKERMSILGYMMRKGFGRREIIAAFDELGIAIGYEETN